MVKQDMAKYWIQTIKMTKGALSRQLGIPEEQTIPITLLEKIRRAKIGTVIKNPTKKGKREIRVTKLLKKRAVLALNLKRIAQKRKKVKK